MDLDKMLTADWREGEKEIKWYSREAIKGYLLLIGLTAVFALTSKCADAVAIAYDLN